LKLEVAIVESAPRSRVPRCVHSKPWESRKLKIERQIPEKAFAALQENSVVKVAPLLFPPSHRPPLNGSSRSTSK